MSIEDYNRMPPGFRQRWTLGAVIKDLSDHIEALEAAGGAVSSSIVDARNLRKQMVDLFERTVEAYMPEPSPEQASRVQELEAKLKECEDVGIARAHQIDRLEGKLKELSDPSVNVADPSQCIHVYDGRNVCQRCGSVAPLESRSKESETAFIDDKVSDVEWEIQVAPRSDGGVFLRINDQRVRLSLVTAQAVLNTWINAVRIVEDMNSSIAKAVKRRAELIKEDHE